jgi:hypothetical protein
VKTIDDFNFQCNEIIEYMNEIELHSDALISKAIRLYSPLQKGDIVSARGKKLKVKYIDLLVGGKNWIYTESGSNGKFSFSYWGVPVKKDGKTEMKKRKVVPFSHFAKDGVKYYMPSYCQRVVVRAKMDKGCEFYSSYEGLEVRPKRFW